MYPQLRNAALRALGSIDLSEEAALHAVGLLPRAVAAEIGQMFERVGTGRAFLRAQLGDQIDRLNAAVEKEQRLDAMPGLYRPIVVGASSTPARTACCETAGYLSSMVERLIPPHERATDPPEAPDSYDPCAYCGEEECSPSCPRHEAPPPDAQCVECGLPFASVVGRGPICDDCAKLEKLIEQESRREDGV